MRPAQRGRPRGVHTAHTYREGPAADPERSAEPAGPRGPPRQRLSLQACPDPPSPPESYLCGRWAVPGSTSHRKGFTPPLKASEKSQGAQREGQEERLRRRRCRASWRRRPSCANSSIFHIQGRLRG